MSTEASTGTTPYPSDLTDAQWKYLEPLIPPAKRWAAGQQRLPHLAQAVDCGTHICLDWPKRRNGTDYEELTDSGQSMVYIAMIPPMLSRLAATG